MSTLWTELILLYVALPVGLAWVFHRFSYRRAMAPLLWLASALALTVLMQDPTFDRVALVRVPLGHPHLRFSTWAPAALSEGARPGAGAPPGATP